MTADIAPPAGNLLVRTNGKIEKIPGRMTRPKAVELLGGATMDAWVDDDLQHVLLAREDGGNGKRNVAALMCYQVDVCGDVIVTTAAELATKEEP